MTARATLFATAVSIKNFRGYGSFRLELPARPCVVLLSGPNGLGKTSFFEAVEWGLTGSVKRLDVVSNGKADPLDLARRTDGIDSFSVELSFRDENGVEERVTRTQLIPPHGVPPASVGTSVTAVAGLLRSDETRWSVTGRNLADYMHLTHFHAQVAFLRLVTFNAKERWVRVSPLAGADRFERVRINLTNCKAALTKLRDQRSRELVDAIAREQNWRSQLDRLLQMQKLAEAVRDLLPPSDAAQKIFAICEKLGLGAPSFSGRSDVGGVSEEIRGVRDLIGQARREDDQRLDSLGRLRALPQEWAEAHSREVAALARKSSLEKEIAQLGDDVEILARTKLEMQALYEHAQRLRSRSAEFHERITRAQGDREDLVRLEKELKETDRQLSSDDRRLEEAEIELRQKKEALATHEMLLRARGHLREELDAIQGAEKALLEAEMLQGRVATEESRRDSLAETLLDLDSLATAFADEVFACSQKLEVARNNLKELQQSTASLQKALLVIREHLRSEDTTCPVCRTLFEPGQLLILSRESMGLSNPVLAEAEDNVRAASHAIEEVAGREFEVNQERRKLEADLRAVDESLFQLRSMIEKLRSNPLLVDLSTQIGTDEARTWLVRRRGEKNAEIGRIEAALSAAQSGEQLRHAVLASDLAVEALRRNRALTIERRNTRQARYAEMQARVSSFQEEYDSIESFEQAVQGAALESSMASDGVDAAAVSLAKAQAAEGVKQQTLNALAEELAKSEAQVTSATSTLRDLEKRWSDVGLSEPISEKVLNGRIEKLELRRRELERAQVEVANIAAALERWQQAADLQALEQEVRNQSGVLERDAHTQKLKAAVESARIAAELAQRARDGADQLSLELGRITAEFGERALQPFADLFKRYLRALVHDERFHNIEATYESAARSAGLRFRVELGGFGTEAEYILSEGQLGEVSLAAMLAANSAFPWSRWRALLLDDPTQYNDLIHATALFDVLRNLVLFAKHQVVVSTHDSEQAGFFRRKLDSLRIPWIDCRYTGHAADGIVAEVRTSLDANGLRTA